MRTLTCAVAALLALGGLVRTQQVPRKATQEVFRRGGADAPEPYAFAATPRLVVNRAGQIFARIPTDGVVIVFDANGQFVRRIGRRGMGPGEFQNAFRHGVVADTLWVVNWPTPRISKFTTSGAHVSTVRTPYDFGHSFSAPAGLSGLMAGGKAYALPPSPVRGVDTRIALPMVVGDADMRRRDTVAFLPNPEGLFVPGIGTWSFEPVPVGPLVGIDPRGSGIAVVTWDDASPTEMVVRLTGPSGETRWQRRFPSDGVIIPRSVRDSLLAVAVDKVRPQVEAARRSGRGITGTIRDAVMRGLPLPRHYAPARRVLVGLDSTIWIERMEGLSGGSWLVLDGAGNALFDIGVPPDFQIDDASSSWLWGTTTDDDGVAYLTKLRIVDR